jgi:glyoxylase-like metal-dependent hydrolase (beta-lactamase superfamily II)
MKRIGTGIAVLALGTMALLAERAASGQQEVPRALTLDQTEVALVPGVPLTADQQARIEAIRLVRGGLYVIPGVGATSAGNVAVRVTAEGVLIVDDKFEANFEEIVAKIRRVTPQPVRYVLNTHHHGDHTGSNARFMASAEIVMHRNARANMVRLGLPGAGRVAFGDEGSIFLGGAEVRMIHLGRGHTNGDAVIVFPDLRVVHTGDLVLEGQRQDGTRLLPLIDAANGGSGREWLTTLDRLLDIDFDVAIPGHGFLMTKADVRRFRQRLETLTTRVQDAIRSGVTKGQLAAAVRTDDLGWGVGGRLTPAIETLYEELRGTVR